MSFARRLNFPSFVCKGGLVLAAGVVGKGFSISSIAHRGVRIFNVILMFWICEVLYLASFTAMVSSSGYLLAWPALVDDASVAPFVWIFVLAYKFISILSLPSCKI